MSRFVIFAKLRIWVASGSGNDVDGWRKGTDERRMRFEICFKRKVGGGSENTFIQVNSGNRCVNKIRLLFIRLLVYIPDKITYYL